MKISLSPQTSVPRASKGVISFGNEATNIIREAENSEVLNNLPASSKFLKKYVPSFLAILAGFAVGTVVNKIIDKIIDMKTKKEG